MRLPALSILLFSVTIGHPCFAQSEIPAAGKKVSVLDGVIFRATFDATTDAKVLKDGGDGAIHTAATLAMKNIKPGNQLKSVTIAKAAGVTGDALHFAAKTKEVLIYKSSANGFHPQKDWAGTVSVWLKLDPDKDLPPGFCDPLQITSKKWNDASFFIDFDKTLPRDFRLGVFSDYKFWNPKDTNVDTIPMEKRPMVPVKKPPFASDKWTHVAFTFSDLNSSTKRPSTATLYIDGKPQGTLNQPMQFTWTKPNEKSAGAVIMLGIGYVGYMDNLTIWQRALSPAEVMSLHKTLK